MFLRESLQQFPPGSKEAAQVKALLAETLLRQGNIKEAKKEALEVLDQFPEQVAALTVVGLVSLEKGEVDEAIENLAKAYRLKPNAFLAGRLSRAHQMAGEENKALEILQRALEKNPRDEYLFRQYTSLKKKLGRTPLEESELLSRFSEEDETSLAYAEQLRERLEEMVPQKAVLQLKKIIKVGKRKNNPHLYILLGDLYRKAKDEKQAAEAYRVARELNPKDAYALAHEAFSLRRMGEIEKAWPLLKTLVSMQPDHDAGKSALVKDAAELGRVEEAIEFFEELLLNFPQHKELYGYIKRLKKKNLRLE